VPAPQCESSERLDALEISLIVRFVLSALYRADVFALPASLFTPPDCAWFPKLLSCCLVGW